MKPTAKQAALLKMTAADGILETTGVDRRNVNARTLDSCIDRGWMARCEKYQHWAGPYNQPTGYKITDAGRAALQAATGGADHG